MMRWFSTVFLAILATIGVLWLGFGDWTRQQLGLSPAGGATTARAASTVILRKHLEPGAVRRIERTLPGGEVDVLTRAEDGSWTQPGQWPVRQTDVQELVKTLCDINTRFLPIPIPDNADLAAYGLAAPRQPITIRVDTGSKTLTLTFGQAPLAPGESPFGQATYLRVDDYPELLRLGPDVWAAISKPAEVYRRRQLFPDFARVKLSGGEPPFNPLMPQPLQSGRTAIPTDRLAGVRVEGPAGGYEIRRTAPMPQPRTDPDNPSADPVLEADSLAEVWELAEIAEAGAPFKPLRDRVSPAKLRGALTAIPELWAERFVADRTEAETGLDKPQRSVQLQFSNGTTATLRIGRLARVATRNTAPPPPSPFGEPPPPPQNLIDEFYYARLDNNPLMFELNGSKLNELFVAAADLRDPAVARFQTDDVVEVAIAIPGKAPLQFTKKKGDKTAEKEDERRDRWYLDQRLAETPRITELLDSLSRLETRDRADMLDETDASKLAELGFTDTASTVTIVTEQAGTRRTLTFSLGKHDAEAKKLYVKLNDWPRINRVPDDVLKLIERPALAYRGRRLFDTAEAKLISLAVKPQTGETYTLTREADQKWLITEPAKLAADPAKATDLADTVSRLEVIEYVNDAPQAEDLDAKFGLATPHASVQVTFEGGREQIIEIGKEVEFKAEFYARLAGSPTVFTLPKATVDQALSGALGLLPRELWSIASDKVREIEISRAGGEKYKLSMDAGNWKLSGPFEAPIPYFAAQPLLSAASRVQAEKYETLAASDLARFGLAEPVVTISVTAPEPREGAEQQVTRVISIGGEVPGAASQRYAMLQGSPAVFAMPDSLFKEADKPALDRLDRTMRTLDQNSLIKVELATRGQEQPVVLVRENNEWKLVGQTFRVDALILQALLSNLARPVATSIAAYAANPELAAYGLDTAEYTIVATTNDMNSHTLRLGKPAADGGRYVRVDDSPAIGILPDSAVRALIRTPLELVDRTMLNFNADQLAGFKRTMGGSVLEILPGTTGGWEITAPPRHKADSALLDDLADRLSRLRAEAVAAFQPMNLQEFGLAEPFAVIALQIGLETPREFVLKLGQETNDGNGDRYATVDGQTVAVLPKPLIDRLTADPLKYRDRSLARFVDADRVTLKRGEREAVFAKVSGTWKLVKPLEAPAEQADLDELIDAVARLRADEIVAENPESLEPYGLDNPQAVWTFGRGDTEVLKLMLGNREQGEQGSKQGGEPGGEHGERGEHSGKQGEQAGKPGGEHGEQGEQGGKQGKQVGDRIYAKLEGSGLVVLLDPKMSGRLLAEYRRRAVWTGVDAAQVEVMVVSDANRAFTFRKSSGKWVNPEEPNESIDAQAVSEFLDKLAGLKAERYVADDQADLKLYGLEPPERVIVLTLRGGSTRTLHLGREEGGAGGRVYARVASPDRRDVIVLAPTDASVLNRSRTAFVSGKKP